MPDDKIKLLYDSLNKEYDLGSYDDFRTQLGNPQKRKSFYDTFSKDYELGSFEDFSKKIVTGMPLAQEVQMNWIPSVGRAASNMFNAVTSPIQSGKAIGETLLGAAIAQNPTARAGLGVIPHGQESLNTFSRVAEAEKERFLNPEKTLREDPFGFALDVANVAVPAVKGIGGLMKASTVPSIANMGSKVVRGAEIASAVADPFSLPATAVKGAIKTTSKVPVVGRAYDKIAQSMYEKVAKLGSKVSLQDRSKLIGVALENEIQPTVQGFIKLKNLREKFDMKIGELVDSMRGNVNAPTIKRQKLLDALDDVLTEEKASPFTGDMEATVKKLKEDIIKKYPQDEIPAIVAQESKMKLGEQISQAAWDKLENPTKTRLYKTTYETLKTEIADQFPDLAKVNKNDSSLRALERALEPIAKKISERTLLSMTGSLITYGVLIKQYPLVWAGMIKEAFTNPNIQSAIAIALHKAQKSPLKRSGLTRNISGAVEASRVIEEGKNE